MEAPALEAARAGLPELPWARASRLVARYGLSAHDASVLCGQRELADYFEACAAVAEGRLSGNWVMTEVLRVLRERGGSIADFAARVPAVRLGGLVARVAAKEMPGAAREAGLRVDAGGSGRGGRAPRRATASARWAPRPICGPLVLEVLAEHDGAVAQVPAGNSRTFDFLVGQVMKKSRGQAAPQVVQGLLAAELARRAAGDAPDRVGGGGP